jgi:hypothetical protein
VLHKPEDVPALRLGEVQRLDETAQLTRIVMRDCRFDSLTNSLALGELPAQPA